ncbi:MAG: phosphodiesterase [Candidatus Adiutrix sp.]|jgi:putative phosphoesterase|nr:phosphodiesterase [Candidatus Adiutrix sp.]
MRLFIASDLHGSAAQAARIRAEIEKTAPEAVVFLGDLLYHGPRNPLPEKYEPAEVAAILGGLGRPILAIRGNCDSEVDQMVLPFHLAESLWIMSGPHPILAVHGHELPANGGNMKVPEDENVVILFGHIHLPVAEKRGPNHYWNPGSAALPKDGLPPSYGFYENGRFEVRTFDGRVLASDDF